MRKALIVACVVMLAALGSAAFAANEESAPATETETSFFPTPIPSPLPTPGTCGGNVCGKGEYCCNASCGTCAPLGASCTQQVCDPVEIAEPGETSLFPTPIPFPLPDPGTCGGNVCGKGEYCCNASCGTCAPLGASCTQQV